MPLEIFNTLSRTKEPFQTIAPGRVSMYVCGPTVYDRAHVGHARSSLVFDVIRRYLEHKGYQVTHVMNYTDVDDKVIRRARELGVEPLDLAERYIGEYDRHLEDLHILPPHIRPRVSQEMGPIIEMVRGLVERGSAYELDGDVYFHVRSDGDYGKLSGRALADMRSGARLEVDERKEDPVDFALWKRAKPGEPSWESPWGEGRPGWHIECSAMSLRHLGEQIDIHGGGNDLVFPHHENEIAQTESLTGKSFARYWVHNGMMMLGSEAMSKSTGNVFSIEAFLSRHDADALRLLVLGSHYRSPLTFNEEVVEQQERGLARLRSALRPAGPSPAGNRDAGADLARKVDATRTAFDASMDDDFNTPAALGRLFDLVRAVNQARDAGAGREELGAAQSALLELAGVLGLRLSAAEVGRGESTTGLVELLLEVRARLRRERQWELADLIRNRLAGLGIVLEDGKEGTTWRHDTS